MAASWGSQKPEPSLLRTKPQSEMDSGLRRNDEILIRPPSLMGRFAQSQSHTGPSIDRSRRSDTRIRCSTICTSANRRRAQSHELCGFSNRTNVRRGRGRKTLPRENDRRQLASRSRASHSNTAGALAPYRGRPRRRPNQATAVRRLRGATTRRYAARGCRIINASIAEILSRISRRSTMRSIAP